MPAFGLSPPATVVRLQPVSGASLGLLGGRVLVRLRLQCLPGAQEPAGGDRGIPAGASVGRQVGVLGAQDDERPCRQRRLAAVCRSLRG